MTKLALMFPLVSLVLLPPCAGQERKDKQREAPKWSVLALRIEKRSPGAELGSDDGIRVNARFHLPDRLIVSINLKECKVDTFTDDKGTNLLGKPPRLGSWQVVNKDTFSNDVVIFRAPGTPTAGASKVRIKGNVAVFTAKDEMEIEKKDVSFQTGVDLGFGTLKSHLTPVGSASLFYAGTRPIKKATVDVSGKTLDLLVHTTYGAEKPGARSEFRIFLSVHPFERIKQLDRGTIRISYFDTVEQLMIPVDLEVGVGL